MFTRKPLFIASLLVLMLLAQSCGLFGGEEPTATPVPPLATAVATELPTAAPATSAPAPTAAPTTAAATVVPAATQTAVSAPATAVPVAASPTTAAAAPTATTAPAVTEAEGEEVVLPDLPSLDAVDSLEAVMDVTLTSPEDGTVVSSVHMIVQADRAADAEHVLMESTDEGGEPVSIEMVTIGDDSWMSFGEGWMHTKASADEEGAASGAESLLILGDEALDSVQSPRLVKKGETVNGIVTDHYAFDESNASSLETLFISDVSGEVWISQDGQFVVKMVIHGTGAMPEDDDSETEKPVVMDMTWELVSINQPVVIEPPAGFAEEDALPIMADALSNSSYFSTAEMATYEIEATAEDVLQWYKDTLTAGGYTLEDETEMEGMSSATYSQDATTVMVMVTDAETAGVVTVMVTKTES